MRSLIAVFCLILFLPGCRAQQELDNSKSSNGQELTLNPGQESTIFPLKVGNQWVYDVETGSGKQELTLKVTKADRSDGNVVATIMTKAQNGPSVPSDWIINSKGVFQISTNGKDKYSPPNLSSRFQSSQRQSHKLIP